METLRIIYRDGFEIDIDADYFETSPLYVRFFKHLDGGWLGLGTNIEIAQFDNTRIRGITRVSHIHFVSNEKERARAEDMECARRFGKRIEEAMSG